MLPFIQLFMYNKSRGDKMDINKISSNKPTLQSKSISMKKADKNFSEEFGSATKREREKQLGQLLHNIKRKGKMIVETRSITVVHEYKDSIREYLSLALQDAYRVDKLKSIYGNPSTLVDIINKELDSLVQTVLVQEKDTIEVVNMIENIEGLLIDTYK